ncbi:uncharacterized protein LOC110208183 [Phascolarctos cinereus]
MGRRYRIFPKELVQFPQNSFCHQASSVLLPCPPHRISPFWEKEYQSRADLVSLLNQTSSTPNPPQRHCHKNIQEPPPWFKHSAITSKMPQLNRAMVVPLPHLHHLAKPSPPHKQRTVVPVLPLPRTDITTKKTPGALTPLGPKHQRDSPSDPNHRLENPSGSDHLPKIFPACDHSDIEDLTLLNQKNPIPPFSKHQTEVPLCEGHRPRAATIARIFSDTQAKTNGPFTRTPIQEARVLPRPRRQIKATNALLGLFSLDPVLHPLAKSLPFTLWTRTPHFRTSVLNYWVQAQPLKASHCDLQPREAVPFLQCLDHHPRPLAVPTAHLNQRNRATAVCRYNPCLLRAPGPIAHVSVQAEQDNWEAMLLRKYLLDTCPSSPDIEPSATPPEPSTPVKNDKDSWETISQGTDIQNTPPSSSDLEMDTTPEPAVHMSIKTGPDTWDATSPRTDLQETLPSSTDTETDTAPEPIVHMSIQTGPDTWDTTSPRTDLQETLPSSTDTETDTAPEPTVHVSIQTEPDTWDTTTPETDQEEIPLTDQDDEITVLGSRPQNVTLCGPRQWTTPPLSPDPWAEHVPDSNALITLHPELEQWETMPQETDHLATLPSSPDLDTKTISEPFVHESVPVKQKYWETILTILPGIFDHQEIIIDEAYETAPPLDLDGQENILFSPEETTTPLPSPSHQTEDISNPDVQATLQQKLEQWATLSEETNRQDTLILSTESETENTPVLIDPISDVIEQEKVEIIDIMPVRIERKEPNQTVEDPWSNRGATTLSLGHDDEENDLHGPDHQTIPPLSPDQKRETEDTAHDLAQDLVTSQESGEMTPPRTDLKTTILTGQDDEETTSVDLDPEDPAQLVHESQITPPLAEDIPDLSAQMSLQPEPVPSDTMSPGTELQDNIQGDQDQRVTPPSSLDHEEMTLSSPDHCTTHPSSPDRQSEAAEDLSTQAVSPTDREHSAKLSEGQEQVKNPPSPNLSVHLPSTLENEAETGTEPTKPPSTPPDNLDDEETVPPSPDKTISPSSSNHQTESPTGHDHQPETELSSDHQDEVESGLPYQLHTLQNRQRELHLNYIKPYTVEAGTVSDRTVHAIINSIPQEKIKNDICKQILLPLSLHRYSPCDYIVCLICASWIPAGCPHEGMKYPCEAHLQAIPIPMPTSEVEIDVKFVLKCPQATVSSLFSTSNTHSHLKKSSEGAESSHSDSVIPVPSRPKWFHFILGKSLPQGKKDITRNPELSIDKTFEEGSNSKEGEKAKVHRTSFRSLLERFQWRRKETK